MSQEPAAGPDRFGQSVDHLRDTAKWILIVFASIGAVLIAGSQLSSVGRFGPGDWQLWVALAAVLVALGGVGVAIWHVLSVVADGQVTLSGINDRDEAFLRANAELLEGYELAELRKAYAAAVTHRHAAAQAGNEDLRREWDAWVDYLGVVVEQLLSVLRYDRVVRRFDGAKPVLFATCVAAGLAVAVFAWVANPEAPPTETPPFRLPAEAVVQLTASGRETLVSGLGRDCVRSPVRVVVLGEMDGVYDIVSVPTDRCGLARFRVSDEVGAISPTRRVEIPTDAVGGR